MSEPELIQEQRQVLRDLRQLANHYVQASVNTDKLMQMFGKP